MTAGNLSMRYVLKYFEGTLLSFFVLLSASIVAGGAQAKEMPKEWVACKTSLDCVVVSSSCGPSAGVNIKYKSRAQAEICKTENCSGSCDGSAIQAYTAICTNGECRPDYWEPPPPSTDVHSKLK